MTATPAAPVPSSGPRPVPILTVASAHMAIVWGSAVVITMVFGYGLDPVDEVAAILANGGVTDAQSEAAAFAAGFTLPVVLGTAVTVLLLGSGALAQVEAVHQPLVIALIFIATGFASTILGLGLAPGFADVRMPPGPPYLALPLFALQAYASSYGFPLLVVGLALGAACGLQAYRWLGMNPQRD